MVIAALLAMNLLTVSLNSQNQGQGPDRGPLGYTLTAAAMSSDSIIFDEEQLPASTTALGDSVIVDKSSLLAAAAPVKIARRR